MNLKSLLFLLACSAMLIVSCELEDYHTPEINLTTDASSSNVEPNNAATFAGTITDASGLTSFKASAPDLNFSTEESISGTSHDFSFSLTPTTEGSFPITMEVKNSIGLVTQLSRTLVSSAPDPCPTAADRTIIIVTAPEPPAGKTIGLVGSETGWGGNPDVTMLRRFDGKYCAPVDWTGGEFKLRLESDWGQQATKADGSDSDNIMFTPNLGGTFEATVIAWRQ